MAQIPYYRPADGRLGNQANPAAGGMAAGAAANAFRDASQAMAYVQKEAGDQLELLHKIDDDGEAAGYKLQVNDINAKLQEKIAENPFAFDKHLKWADDAAARIRELKPVFYNPELAARFGGLQQEDDAQAILIGTAKDVQQGKIQIAGRNAAALTDMYFKEGNYNAAIESVMNNPLKTDMEKQNSITDIHKGRILNEYQERLYGDPFEASKYIDSEEFKNLPFDLQMNIRSASEKALKEAREKIRDEYTNQLFKNIKLDEKKLQSDVDSGRVDPSFALSIRAAEVRRTKAIEAEKASELETYTDPKDYAEFEAKLSAYDPSNDPGGKQFTELETFLNTGQFGKAQRELFTSDLKSMRNGKVPARLSGLSGELRNTVNKMFDDQRLGVWKDNLGNVETAKYDAARKIQYGLIQNIDKMLMANPKMGYEEAITKINNFIGDGLNSKPIRYSCIGGDLVNPKPDRPSSRLNLPSSTGDIRSQMNKAVPSGLNEQTSAKVGGLAPHLNDFEEAGREYGVDPNLLIAVSCLETGKGASPAFRNKNNAMGVSPNGGGPRAYSSVRESIFDAARNLKKNYIDKGLVTIEAIGRKYSPPGAANDPHGTNSGWASNVTKVYRELTGKSELDLSFGNVPLETQALTMLNGVSLKGFPRDAAVQSFVNELAKNHKIEPGQYSGIIRMVNDKWDVDNA